MTMQHETLFLSPFDDIGVSDATIRNWNRLGVSGTDQSAKLTSRANKRLSEKTFKPEEYSLDKNQLAVIDPLLHYAEQHRLNHSGVLCLAAASIARGRTNNPVLAGIIRSWEEELGGRVLDAHKPWFCQQLSARWHADFLGLLYQSLLTEGKKATRGSYYTPQSVARAMLEDHCTRESTVLDPACGTGQFLLAAASFVDNPACLFGIDNDPTAVRIAKINLMLRFPDLVFEPNIFSANTLLDFDGDMLPNETNADVPFGFFDLVATNPPWGSHRSKQEKTVLARRFPQIRSGESFSCFLVQATKFAKKGGVISFLLPESVVNIKVHSDIRNYLTEHCLIQSIQHLGRLFTGVFTPVIRLDIVNDKPRAHAKTASLFTVSQNENDRRIIQKIESCPVWHLKNHAQFALGIVTGNNERHLLKAPLPDSEPIFRGKEVMPFVFKSNAEFIAFQPEQYQQTAPEHLYRAAEKLIYRFISKDLVFAYDDQQRLTLNSANVLIPTRTDFSVKVLCAVFNSDLMRFVYRKKFHALKVLRGNLEELPLPNFSPSEQETLLSLVDEFLETKNNLVLDEMNQKMYHYYEIDTNEVRYIAEELRKNKTVSGKKGTRTRLRENTIGYSYE